ncbi:uncharacterized protein LACBIDRAFT_316706 [Laccaria bicolor S238N-H82]|uniref:Predicted protein n=1 Tax=Laccaria bicolor (strain S238N-H82 / ATCC MYA-4686) TaxID=486041 RepID=B0E1G8_LACBS|nr:uncharacterized protein LACBIDRAFT_316706 [Laccaria bicolor S238N-H82]EDQ99305.1 predicted protein [Laccaria bicolor S238N-H82]|eukprot:XP_001890025.1 predicted protein [Laccaria bicolor S238N-H82]
MTSIYTVPEEHLQGVLPTLATAKNVVPRIVALVEACWEWYGKQFSTADDEEKRNRELGLRRVMVSITYLRAIHVIGECEDIELPPLMDRVCEEVLGSKSGEFNWQVLEDPSPEPADEFEELDVLMSEWLSAQPSDPKGKGKAKETSEIAKPGGGSETGKPKGKGHGQKRKADVSVEEGKDVVRGKKVKIQAGGSEAGPAPPRDDDDDEADYDYQAMGATVTPGVRRPRPICNQCIRRGDSCKSETAIRGQACDSCRAKKSRCSFVGNKGPMNLNQVTSRSPKEEVSTPSLEGKVQATGSTSKAQGTGKPKPKCKTDSGRNTKPAVQTAQVPAHRHPHCLMNL